MPLAVPVALLVLVPWMAQ